LRKDVEITLKQLEDEHRIKERALKTDIRSLHVMLKEQELSQEDYTFALKAENDKRQTELRQEFERKANDLKKKYDLKMLKVRSEMENHRKQLIKALEEKKD
jgi:growth arrest-specific protein 8